MSEQKSVTAKMKVCMVANGKNHSFTMAKLKSDANPQQIYAVGKAVGAWQEGDVTEVHEIVDTKIEG
ncbi:MULTISPECIES: hypothetical protein [Megasphaera]|jgi:hypothetical protein|uniref:DUF1659 domain-containing protein n=1 Tax=Megasphaera hutchinsoni TaxID=1588748 RepID=A0A134CLP3_9FIRM|nr:MULTISPECIES: hypothetical protein [Megasphaera]MUP47973.1 hypothetical protein [Veillonellaceae bacterium M2-8]MUP58632.1 hypothetical protein [Veillonellaceae bacterium M2-4]EGS32793.1 hypothetical protein HMPREF1040_0334 [Megasphaera sp. UPII 135-E]KXB93132.1 hypothetical protein HMPREF3182_00048 [Megasphaera hutchinsoni]PNH20729.1 hypothetical protein CAL30_07210 [Megasphaera genomosp. type_2]